MIADAGKILHYFLRERASGELPVVLNAMLDGMARRRFAQSSSS